MVRLARLDIVIQSTHPDQLGGLELLINGQLYFSVIFTALGATLSATLAREIIYFGLTMPDVQWTIFGYILIILVIIIGPMCIFSLPLYRVKQRNKRRYSVLATKLSEAFDQEWLNNSEERKGDFAAQALRPSTINGYKAIYEMISNMRLIPLKKQKIFEVVAVLLIPFIPLIFVKISIQELLVRLLKSIV